MNPDHNDDRLIDDSSSVPDSHPALRPWKVLIVDHEYFDDSGYPQAGHPAGGAHRRRVRRAGRTRSRGRWATP